MRAINLHDSAELVGVLTGTKHNSFLAGSLRECLQCQILLCRSAMFVLVPQRLTLDE